MPRVRCPGRTSRDAASLSRDANLTLRTKRRVDYWVGGFLLALLFVPVRLLGILLRRDHSLARRRGCAVIKLVGAGSLFLAMPSMHEIRRRFPEGRFFLVGSPAVVRTAQEFGWFDEYWIIDDSSLWRLATSTLRTLWRMRRHVDHLIDLEVHSRLTSVISTLSMVRNRLGFVDDLVFWRRAYYTHMIYFNVHGPVYVFYDLMAKWFGAEGVSVSDFHRLFRRHAMAAPLAPDILPRGPFVAVGHGCSELGRERRLEPEEWKRLLLPVVLSGQEIVLVGGPGDRADGDAIVAALGRGRNLCGALTIALSAKVIGRASTFYGIDSMLLHFARALDVPSISVFGPTDPATRLRPLGLRERVAFARLPCSPCIHVNESPPCQGQRTCMALALRTLTEGQDSPPPTAAEAPPVGWGVAPSGLAVHEVCVTSW